MNRPQNIGIKAIEVYIPGQAVSQAELEKFNGVSTGKYTIGLGLTNMAFVNDREDIYSMALTVFSKLIKNYDIDVQNIGRLEVGTETLLDKSKSVKSVLMQLLDGNNDVEGVDTINACYGGTNALFSSISWIESSAWDGRDAVVVCGDIAIYEKGPARPSGGAGVVALLIGPDAPIVFDPVRGTFMDHIYDFYKPDFTSEYPYVDGHYSSRCYVKALDKAYATYSKKVMQSGVEGVTDTTIGTRERFDYHAFHAPTCKFVTKCYARLIYNDFRANPDLFPEVDRAFAEIDYEQSLIDKTVEKTFLSLAKELIKERVQPSLQVSTNTGNMYTASLYAALASLMYHVGSDKLQGKRIGLFSYGSGLAASMFSAVVKGDISYMTEKLDLDKRLFGRSIVTPEEYEAALALREAAIGKKSFKPAGSLDHIGSGVYYLTEVNDRYHRMYAVKE